MKPDLPRWADTVESDPSLVETPSDAKKNVGWVQEMPPFQIENWLDVKTYRCLVWDRARSDRDVRAILRSAAAVTWNGSDVVFSQAIQMIYRIDGASRINQIGAGNFLLADGEVVVLKRDDENASPVSLVSGTYGSLAIGEYDTVLDSALTDDDEENEIILFRRRGTDLEIPLLGAIYSSGASFFLGKTGGTAGYKHTEAAPSATWTITHNFGSVDHMVQIFDGSNVQILPDTITRGANSTTVTFGVDQAGTALLIAVS